MDKAQAGTLYGELVEVLGKSHATTASDRASIEQGELVGHRFQYLNENCSIQGWYHETKELEYGLIKYSWPGEMQGLVVSVGCSGSAMADYYPVDE